MKLTVFPARSVPVMLSMMMKLEDFDSSSRGLHAESMRIAGRTASIKRVPVDFFLLIDPLLFNDPGSDEDKEFPVLFCPGERAEEISQNGYLAEEGHAVLGYGILSPADPSDDR